MIVWSAVVILQYVAQRGKVKNTVNNSVLLNTFMVINTIVGRYVVPFLC